MTFHIKSLQVLSGEAATGYIDFLFNDIIERVGQFSEDGSWSKDSYRYLKNAITENRVEFAVAVNGKNCWLLGHFRLRV